MSDTIKTEEEYRQKFKNMSDCYADTWNLDNDIPVEGAVVMAMTEDGFINFLKDEKILITPNTNICNHPENLQVIDTDGIIRCGICREEIR